MNTVRLSAVAGRTADDAYAGAVRDLRDRGLDERDIVQAVWYAKDAAERMIPVEGLLEAEMAVAVELTAHPGGGERRNRVTVADGIVYLPTILPQDLTADFRTQYRSCLETAADLLKDAGLGLDALVQTTDYTATATRADYPRCGRPRKDLLGGTGTDGAPVFPGAAGILVDKGEQKVTLDAVASTAPLRTVNPGWRRYETLTYRPGVLAGDTLFMSGFGALEPATQRAIFDGDLLAQAEFTYAAIATVLREAGKEFRVVRLVEYVTPEGREGYDGLKDLRAKYFPGEVALTSVVCTALLRPEFLIEVIPTAVRA
ncbi:RidA family protein [Nonomuraea sp. NPDC050556]|uniref:RidA family protein n=1 Tax=Nonomuraea sp. NPDC050556 TaxID=3364369 RepID=UPI00379C5751